MNLLLRIKLLLKYKHTNNIHEYGKSKTNEPHKFFLKVGLSSSKKYFLFASVIPFKNDGKCFSFHLKRSFCSQDIYIFVLTF